MECDISLTQVLLAPALTSLSLSVVDWENAKREKQIIQQQTMVLRHSYKTAQVHFYFSGTSASSLISADLQLTKHFNSVTSSAC